MSCFDGHVHRSLMGFPGMRERTVKIGSRARSSRSPDGSRLDVRRRASPRCWQGTPVLTFTTPPNLQAAAATGWARMRDFRGDAHRIPALARPAGGGTGRARLCVLPSVATYFLSIDLARSGVDLDDLAFCEMAG